MTCLIGVKDPACSPDKDTFAVCDGLCLKDLDAVQRGGWGLRGNRRNMSLNGIRHRNRIRRVITSLHTATRFFAKTVLVPFRAALNDILETIEYTDVGVGCPVNAVHGYERS